MSAEEEYGLVYPFVVTSDNGGTYDPDAFVAGVQFGQIDQLMESGTPIFERYVASGIVPQLDLAAMHHGYSMTAEAWDEHPAEWTRVSLTRNSPAGGRS